MAKRALHPELYKTQVFCGGKQILQLLTTKKELHVDVWAGNHPFYTGSQKFIDTEGRINKFERRYNLANNATT